VTHSTIRPRAGLTLIELVVAVALITIVTLATVSALLQSKATTRLSNEIALAQFGADLMVDYVQVDAGGAANFALHWNAYGASTGQRFGDLVALGSNPPIRDARNFGWVDPLNPVRTRLRDVRGWFFFATDVNEFADTDGVPGLTVEDVPAVTALPSEAIAGTNNIFPAAPAGVDLNLDNDRTDVANPAAPGTGLLVTGYTGRVVPVTVVVAWNSGGDGAGAGLTTRRTYKLRTVVPLEN
jgi:prepilin-type N-terminal cleavage/methylation domain-containing protein